LMGAMNFLLMVGVRAIVAVILARIEVNDRRDFGA
jgi:hypothetical protein